MEKSFLPIDSLTIQSVSKLQEKKSEKEKKSSKSKKMLKIKKHAHYYYEKKAKLEENNSLLNFSLDSKMEKKRVYTKRTTEKIRRWTKEEADQYEKFIDMYSDIFNESGSKRVTKVFIQMSQFIGTKTPSQCRSHHQKFFKRLQRARLLAAGHSINEDDFKKKRKNNTKKLKVKKEANLMEVQIKTEEIKMVDETNTTKESIPIKIEHLSERVEENKPIGINLSNSNCSTNNPMDTSEINPACIINNNYYYNNNFFCENQYVFNNCSFTPNYDPKGYLRKPSFYDDKEFAYLLDNKQRRKSSFSFFCGNNNKDEQDFNNFEKIYLSTANPQANYPHHDCLKSDMFFLEENNKINFKKNAAICSSPKKEDVKARGNDS